MGTTVGLTLPPATAPAPGPAREPARDASAMTKAELADALEGLGVEVPARATKAQLLALLERSGR